MAKLVNLIPDNQKKKIVKEDLTDMDVTIPAKIDKFLERTIQIIKGYNLPRKKEQLVIAKVVDSMNMSPSELAQAVAKLKKYGIVKREKTGNADADWMGEATDLDLDDYSYKFQSYFEKKYDGKSFGKWKLMVDRMSGALHFYTKDSDVEILATPFWDGNPKLPVDVQNVNTGDYLSQKEYPLKPNGDMKKDEVSYLRLMKPIFSKVQ